jgi:hypothetical protein
MYNKKDGGETDFGGWIDWSKEDTLGLGGNTAEFIIGDGGGAKCCCPLKDASSTGESVLSLRGESCANVFSISSNLTFIRY